MMPNKTTTFMVAMLVVAFFAVATPRRSTGSAAEEVPSMSRFVAIPVFVDSGTTPLAAYQFEFAGAGGDILLVGLEGGPHDAFASPPHYDPTALQGNRVVVAAFTTAASETLPVGRVHVATLHLQVGANPTPRFVARLVTAADPDGTRIPATISTTSGDTP